MQAGAVNVDHLNPTSDSSRKGTTPVHDKKYMWNHFSMNRYLMSKGITGVEVKEAAAFYFMVMFEPEVAI